MNPDKGILIVHEGRGESQSLNRLAAKTGRSLPDFASTFVRFLPSQRIPITNSADAVRAAKIGFRYRPDAILLTADLDDDCPRDKAPEWAAAVRELRLPVPVALVLFYREYETLAVSCAGSLAGRELVPGLILNPRVLPEVDPESRRDAKGWISHNLMNGTRYKPTVHQPPLTALMRVEDLRASGLSSFRRFERALQFLAQEVRTGRTGVYPSTGRM